MSSIYQGDASKGEIEITEEVLVFENQFARLYNDKVRFPDGSDGTYVRFDWTPEYSVMILPRHADGSLLLIRNFRHATRSWGWEIPKGFAEPNLTPQQNAEKELFEETGFTSKDWQLTKRFKEGTRDIYLYTAQVDKAVSTPAQEQESGEAIAEARFFRPETLMDLLYSDAILDPETMFCISHHLLMLTKQHK